MTKLDQYWRRLLWSLHYYRPSHDVTIETANGRLSCNSRDWLIGKQLYIQRNYEFDFIRKSLDFLRSEGLLQVGKNNTVVDIGANLGMICIALLDQEAFEHAIAFEPSPESFRLLEKNAAQNSLEEKIQCFPFALSSRNEELTFEIARGNSGDNRIRETLRRGKMDEGSRKTFSALAKTFDTFLEETEIDPHCIDLFWIDIQGHEGHFFQGANQFFSQRKVPVITEFWSYGIGRSGMSQDEYCAVVENTFSMFYHFVENKYLARPISELRTLFAKYSGPREIANIILSSVDI